jgi:signal transduction histidine kinase
MFGLIPSLVEHVLKPNPRVTDAEGVQKSRLLSAILVALFAMDVLILLWVYRTDPNDLASPMFQGAALLASLLIISYTINKLGYSLAASILTIFFITAVFLSVPFFLNEDPIYLAFLMVPVLMTAMFLPFRWTIIFVSVLLVGMTFLVSIRDPQSEHYWNFRNMMYFMVAGNGMVLTFEWHVARLEEIRQRELIQAKEQLEERVQQRTSELEKANKELEAFAFSVSHDLRSPLRGIDGFIKILQNDYSGNLDESGQKFLGRVRENTDRMNQLIEDLLAFSRLGRQNIHRTQVEMSGIIQALRVELEPEIDGRQIDWQISELPGCTADASLIKQVLFNLLQNAIKYSRHRDTAIIEIGSYIKDQETVYFVKDNGVGFDMRYADKLFGVFQRLHREDEFEGTGVGLAMVQRIIHRHGGSIWFQAEPNAGAAFYFTVPST